jgi:hypothetical protein
MKKTLLTIISMLIMISSSYADVIMPGETLMSANFGMQNLLFNILIPGRYLIVGAMNGSLSAGIIVVVLYTMMPILIMIAFGYNMFKDKKKNILFMFLKNILLGFILLSTIGIAILFFLNSYFGIFVIPLLLMFVNIKKLKKVNEISSKKMRAIFALSVLVIIILGFAMDSLSVFGDPYYSPRGPLQLESFNAHVYERK